MKSGINLGRPPARTRLPLSMALLAVAAGTLALAALYLWTRAEVEALSSQVRELEESLGVSASGTSPDGASLVAARLRLALDSGATDALPPTELLRLVESALPEGVVLGTLAFSATPQPILTLEATTIGGDRVTEMERRLLALPTVATTSLLEERRLADGRLGVRIQVGLARK